MAARSTPASHPNLDSRFIARCPKETSTNWFLMEPNTMPLATNPAVDFRHEIPNTIRPSSRPAPVFGRLILATTRKPKRGCNPESPSAIAPSRQRTDGFGNDWLLRVADDSPSRSVTRHKPAFSQRNSRSFHRWRAASCRCSCSLEIVEDAACFTANVQCRSGVDYCVVILGVSFFWLPRVGCDFDGIEDLSPF